MEVFMIMSFGEKLVLIRKELNMNLSEMADYLDLVKSNLSRYERNMIVPSVDFLKKLTAVFHVNLNWLIGGFGEMFLSEEEIGQLRVEEILSVEDARKLCSSVRRIDIPKYFYTSMGVPVYIQDPPAANFELLPVEGEISAGEPMEIRNNEPLDFVPFPYYRPNMNLDDFLVFRVNGLSMHPDIEHQDIVFIQKNSNWEELNNRVVAVVIAGELTLKKLNMMHDLQEIHLIPINKNFSVIKVPLEEIHQMYLLGELKAIRRISKN